MSIVNHDVRNSVAQQAADWFVRNRDKSVSADDRAAFVAWLRLSPLHIEEYLKTAVTSRDLHAAIDPLDLDIESLLSDARAECNVASVSIWGRELPAKSEDRPVWQIHMGKFAALAVAVLLVLFGAIWLERDGQRFGLPRDFVTVHGEQGSWLLPDGTSLSLNSDSAVTVRYNNRERLVRVRRGQALFQVAHETGRRFRVTAGETGVIAVGTEFDVFRKPASTLITVVEGKVAVFTGAAPMVTSPVSLPTQALSVAAGEQVQVNDDSRPAKPVVVNVQQAVAWVQRQIAFDRRPLGEVAAEFNRYGSVPIVVQNDNLRDLRISGVFNAYDTDSFLAFISRLDGVEIDRTAARILIRGEAQ
jgi:transmembrane sensor